MDIKKTLEVTGLVLPARNHKNAEEKLLMSIRATAKCKFNASLRLKRNSRNSFFATTFLSLGLILIPLLQNSNVKLYLSGQVLNMMQIFLAVAILVYSIVMGKSGLDIRAEKLNECGDRLKDLARRLDRSLANKKDELDLSSYHEKYSDISTDTEGHSRLDFLCTKLDMPNDYPIHGLRWLFFSLKSNFLILSELFIPLGMVLLETVFISDMLGISNFLPSSFHEIKS